MGRRHRERMLHLNNRAASDYGPAIETFGVSELELASASCRLKPGAKRLAIALSSGEHRRVRSVVG
jgi:hypothetical protein